MIIKTERGEPDATGAATSSGKGRIYLVLSVLLYLSVAGLIYREWFNSLIPAPAAVASSQAVGKDEVLYQHHTSQGLHYFRGGDFVKAEEEFRKAAAHAPQKATAYNNLGSALNAQGKWDEAIPLLKKALSIDPDLDIAKNNLAWAEAEKSKRGK